MNTSWNRIVESPAEVTLWSYCQDEYYLIHPDRGKNMNPFRGGYKLESERDEKIIPICHRCVLHLSWRDENFRLK